MSIAFWDETDLILRRFAGMAAGVAVGWERKLKQQSAGGRTFGLTGLGTATAAAVFTGDVNAASRVCKAS
ncbi:MAG: hypothetical protein EOO23_01790 [Comamonadaceae bacterium]|nr:MAG: hypothetical protein EOO23_01790 [Comamonadaceae bacterium]